MNAYEQLQKGRYGSFELKPQVGPNLIKGLVVSFLIHAVAVASPLIYQLLTPEAVTVPDEPTGPVIILPPMRPAHNTPRQEAIQLPRPVASTAAVVPVAVPEEPDEQDSQMVASQDDLRRSVDLKISEEGEGGLGGKTVYVQPPDIEQIPPPDTFIVFEEYPRALPDFSPPPEYPELAKIVGAAGKVFVKVYVDKRGTVLKWQVLASDPKEMGFEDEVLKVIPKWRFTPAIQQGKPIGVWVTVPFNFKIKK